MNIYIVTPEFSPYVKCTGLADLIRDLCSVISRQHKVSVFLPCYGLLKQTLKRGEFIHTDSIPWIDNRFFATGYEVKKNLKIYGIFEHKAFLNIEDEARFYSFFKENVSLPWVFFNIGSAVLLKLLSRKESFEPGVKSVVHCFGWHTGLLPALIKDDPVLSARFKSVFTVDILLNQGVFNKQEILSKISFTNEIENSFKQEKNFNFVRCAIQTADMVTTVSDKFARELQEVPHGFGLEKDFERVTGQGRFVGILNGLNHRKVNPQTTPSLKRIGANFNSKSKDLLERKKRAKEHLQRIACLRVDPEATLISVGHRFSTQKNFILLEKIIEPLMKLKNAPQLFIRTWPEPDKEHPDFDLWWRLINYSRKYRFNIAFFEPYDRFPLPGLPELYIDRFLYYAASDIFLMPSLWEPCGLCQMEAMRYGCLPIVSNVGGLSETVKDYSEDPQAATGFLLDNPMDEVKLLEIIRSAIQLREKKQQQWLQMVKNALNSNFSIENTVNNYFQKVYLGD